MDKEIKEALHEDLNSLRRVRDEVRVQAHLAKMEAQSASWPEIKQKLVNLQTACGAALRKGLAAFGKVFSKTYRDTRATQHDAGKPVGKSGSP